eukprot:TRINITY_DN2459_c0_g2_i3.p1 TRINITY_DN2459_c0_g2~~TRINITY_DN2459_c0_g2_i3.p1  ORF type:complete len:822 (+),score=284.04 TRINITY_DN2459_c0_g2_i3:1364-3829(+)
MLKSRLEATKTNYQSQMQSLSSQLEQLQAAHRDENTGLRSQLDSLVKSERALREQLTSLASADADKAELEETMEETSSDTSVAKSAEKPAPAAPVVTAAPAKSTQALEATNRELLAKLARLSGVGDEQGIELLSELFSEKQTLQDKVESLRKRLNDEVREKNSAAESARKLSSDLDTAKRELVGELNNRQALQQKMEADLQKWKAKIYGDMQESVQRIEAENTGKKDMQEQLALLQAQLNDERRKCKVELSELRTKYELEAEDNAALRRTVDSLRGDIEQLNHSLQSSARVSSEREKAYSAELAEWKQQAEQQVSSVSAKAETTQQQVLELTERNRSLVADLEEVKKEWAEESAEYARKLDTEVKARSALENARRTMKAELDDTKKSFRGQMDTSLQLKQVQVALQVDLEAANRSIAKLPQLTQENDELKLRVVKLEEEKGRAAADAAAAADKAAKKLESLRNKFALEAKMREDINAIKARLEHEVEELEAARDREELGRKRLESALLEARSVAAHQQLEASDQSGLLASKLDFLQQLNATLVEKNDKLTEALNNVNVSKDNETEAKLALMNENRRLKEEVGGRVAAYEERLAATTHTIEAQGQQAAIFAEQKKDLLAEIEKLRGTVAELQTRAQMNAAKRQFEADMQAKKMEFESKFGTKSASRAASAPVADSDTEEQEFDDDGEGHSVSGSEVSETDLTTSQQPQAQQQSPLQSQQQPQFTSQQPQAQPRHPASPREPPAGTPKPVRVAQSNTTAQADSQRRVSTTSGTSGECGAQLYKALTEAKLRLQSELASSRARVATIIAQSPTANANSTTTTSL